MLPIPTTLSYSHPLEQVVIIFHITDKESGSRASYKSLGMHRVSFTLVCMAEDRLQRRLLHKQGVLSQAPLRGQQAAPAQLLSQGPFHREKILCGIGPYSHFLG